MAVNSGLVLKGTSRDSAIVSDFAKAVNMLLCSAPPAGCRRTSEPCYTVHCCAV